MERFITELFSLLSILAGGGFSATFCGVVFREIFVTYLQVFHPIYRE